MNTAINSENALSWTGAVVLILVSVLTLYLLADQGGSSADLAITGLLLAMQCAAFVALVNPWTHKRPALQQALFWAQAIIILLVYSRIDSGFIAILGIVWIVQAGELFTPRTATWLLAAAIGAFALSQMLHWQHQPMAGLSNALTLGLFHVFAAVVTHRFRREQALREEYAALNRELLATRELLSQHSRQNERLRIARNLHDLLGHHLTALILQLEVASHVVDDAGRERVEQALALAKLLLSDLRTAVSELRDEDAIDLPEAVARLTTDLPDLRIETDFHDAPVINDIEVAETLLRCIQEALTNVLRHSQAGQCRIVLAEHYNQYFLTVQDDGGPSHQATPGNGLTGIRERVSSLGGEAQWDQSREGFRLQVRIPVEADS